MSYTPSFGPGSVIWGQIMQVLLDHPELFPGWPRSSGPGHPHGADLAERKLAPQPSPAKTASVLLNQLSLKEIALKLPEGSAKSNMLRGIDAAIADELDECGTPWPGWHWPGPPPWIYEVVSILGMAANSFQAGYLKQETFAIATKVLEMASTPSEQG